MAFQREVRALLGLPQGSDFEVTFECRAPTTGECHAAAHWSFPAEAPVVAPPQLGRCSALRTHPLPQPTASSLVVDSFF